MKITRSEKVTLVRALKELKHMPTRVIERGYTKDGAVFQEGDYIEDTSRSISLEDELNVMALLKKIEKLEIQEPKY